MAACSGEVCGVSSRVRTVPTTSGLDPKRRVQAPWLSSATRSAPVRASVSVKSRPSCGLARSSGNSEGDTHAPLRAISPPFDDARRMRDSPLATAGRRGHRADAGGGSSPTTYGALHRAPRSARMGPHQFRASFRGQDD